MSRLVVFALAVLSLSGVQLRGDEGEASAPAASTVPASYGAVFLAEQRPVFLRVEVKLQGAPVEQRWQEHARRLFTALDRDQDGRVSDIEFAKASAPSSVDPNFAQATSGFFRALTRGLGGGTSERSATTDDQARGMDFDAFMQKYERQKSALSVNESLNVFEGDQLIWQRADTNGDGQLSWPELEQLHRALGRLDVDGNEVVSRGELAQFRNPLQQQASGMAIPGAHREFFVLMRREDAVLVVERMLAVYLPPKAEDPTARSTRRGEIPVADAVFDRADQDADEIVTAEEWLAFVLDPLAEFTWTVDLSAPPNMSAGAQPAPWSNGSTGRMQIQRHAEYGLDDAHVQSGSEQSAAVVAGGSKLSFRLAGAGMDVGNLFIQQFSYADSDKNEYIDQAESQRHGYFAAGFRRMDLDGDGKLFLDELKQFLARMEDELGSRVELHVQKQNRELFALWDRDDDGRLAPREQRVDSAEFQSWDRNDDGLVHRDEVPRVYTVLVGRGRPQMGLDFLDAQAATAATRSVVPAQDLPDWFRWQDRNMDGDLSPREFLGPVELFQQMDHNRDGFVAADEARAKPSSPPAP